MVRSNSAILLALIRKARSSELIRNRGGVAMVKSLNMGLWERFDRAGFGKECWLGLEHE